MSTKKKILALAAATILLIAFGFGTGFYLARYTLVGGHIYQRDLEYLDLSGKDISLAQRDQLNRKLPYTVIDWDIPIGDSRFPSGSQTITLDSLRKEDLRAFSYFSRLQTVKAENCRDYALLQTLQRIYPELTVHYKIQLGDTRWDQNCTTVEIPALSQEELGQLAYLPNLKKIVCTGGDGALLQQYCQEKGLDFAIRIGDTVLKTDAVAALLKGITDEELPLLRLLPNLMNLHIVEPTADPVKLVAMREELSHVKMTWEKMVCDLSCPSDAKQVDLTQASTIRLQEVAACMGYFPDTNIVYLGNCELSNEELAGYRDTMRDSFKLVWVVTLGSNMHLRSDATVFAPYEHNIYFMNDQDAENLRYCEDMVCLDLSRLTLTNLDFVSGMPNLTYLTLSGTQLKDISAISSCKNLKFLEMDSVPVKDLAPLTGCTGLEDLNISSHFYDMTPIGDMPWLKNLWAVNCNYGIANALAAALPGTQVYSVGLGARDGGWRELDNFRRAQELRNSYDAMY